MHICYGATWSLSPSHHYNGERDLKIFLNILEKIFFLLFPGDRPLRGESKLYGGVIFITTLLFISLETANTQKSKVFLLRTSSENVNTPGVVTG